MNISNVNIKLPIRNDAHVVPLGKMWAVKMELYSAYSGVFKTQTEATSYAVEMARASAASVVIHNSKGVIRDVWSYKVPVKTTSSFS